MKLKEILKDTTNQLIIILGGFVGINIIIGFCWYAKWLWRLIM